MTIKQVCSSAANHFSVENRLAAVLQIIFLSETGLQQCCKSFFLSETGLQQCCKSLFCQKQACSSAANHFSVGNRLAAVLQITFLSKISLQQCCKPINGCCVKISLKCNLTDIRSSYQMANFAAEEVRRLR